MTTNIILEDHIIAFRESLRDVHTLKTLCISEHNPISHKSCETIITAHKSLHTYNFVKSSNPNLVIPVFKRTFEEGSTWESTMCGLANHRLVDYVIDARSIDMISVVDRFCPDFGFVDRYLKTPQFFDSYIKKTRIKLVRV